ncbi:MAG TPA: Ig-like domain-containing protein [bacterium]|nr:Ig-like domain-containing protein [bacterium]
MRRIVALLIWVVFLSLVAGACSSKEQCSADSDCKAGYACGDDQKCHQIEVKLLFQDITDGQIVTTADDVDKSDDLIQINITVAAQTTAGAIKDGTSLTLEVKSAAEQTDTDAVSGSAQPTVKNYAGTLVNGTARFLSIPFEAGTHTVTAYITLSPAIKVTATLTVSYDEIETLVMRYYKAGTVPTILEGADLDDNDDLKKDTDLFQVKMEAVTTGYPDGQKVDLFIEALSNTPVGSANIQNGVATFPEITVPIAANIVMKVKTGTYEDTLSFSAASEQSCGFALNIQNDDRFGIADDENTGLNNLQKTLIISDVSDLCSVGSAIEIYIDGTPGTDEPDETLTLGAASVEQSITLPESISQADTHTLTVVMKDDDSSATGSMTVTGLFIDITPPELSITAPVENATLTPVDDINTTTEGIQIAVTGKAIDELSDSVAVEVRNGTTLLGDTTGDGPFTVAEISFTETNEALTLAVTARDAIGNETVVEVPLKVYVNDPAIAFQTICARTPAMNMQLNTADDGDQLAAGVQCTVIVRTTDIESATTEVSLTINDETPIVETIGTGGLTIFDTTTLPDGEDSITASVMHLGVLRTAALTVQVDSLPPAAPTVSGTTPTNDTTPTWSWNTPADTVEFRYSFTDGSGWTVTTDTDFTATALAVGTHTLYVQGRDAAGNWSTSGSFAIVIDTTAPAAPTVDGITPTNDTTPTWSWNTPAGTVEFRHSFTNGSPWTVTTDTDFTATALAVGTHTLYVQGRDAAGNWSTSGSFAIVIDTTAPAAPTVTGTTPTNDTTPAWSWNTPAGAVEYRFNYTGDDIDWTTTSAVTFSPDDALIEGEHTLFVQARDAAGNWSDSGWFTITIDTSAPDAPTVLATTPTNDPTPNWTWIPVTDAVNYRYSYTDGLNWTETTNTSFTAATLTAGTYTLYVQAQDAAGNWSLSGSKEVVIDLSVPDAPVVTGTSPTNDTTPEWSWNAVTDAVEYRYSFTDGNGWATTTDLSFTPGSALTEGSHTLFVQARNGVGTWSGSGYFTVEIDITGPDAPTVDGISPTNNPTPTWSWNTPTDTVEFRYSYDESSWTTIVANSFTPSPLIDGSYTLYVQGRDALGNWSDSGSFEIVIDTEAPAAPMVNGTTPTNDTTPLWSWDTPADTVNFRYSYDESDWTTTVANSFTATTLTAGTYTLYVQAADALGNWSDSGSFAITIDTTEPTLVIGAPSATEAKTGDSVLYTVTYTGADSVTLATGHITLNTTDGASGTVTVTGSGTTTRTVTISNLTGNGTLGISIAAGTASDNAGNTALAAGPSDTFDVDNTPPTVLIDPVNACTRRTTGTITFTVTGATTTTCRFDTPAGNGTPSACGGSYGYTLANGEGTYTLTVTATDDANNSDTQNTSFSLNTTTPTFQWSLPPNGTSYKAGSAVPSFVYRTKNLEAGETVEIIDADTGLAVASGTTAGSLCNAQEDLSIPLDLPDKCGTYKLYAKVNDGVDSVDRYTDNRIAAPTILAEGLRSFTFDRDKPVISSFVVVNDANSDNFLVAAEDLDATPANGMQATIVITIQDDIDIGRTVTLRNKTTGNIYTATVAGDRTATFTSITIPELLTPNSFGATVVDCGGNTSDESSKNITVDTTPPSVLFQGPTGATSGHQLWLTARDGTVVADELTGQQLKFKITGDWNNATPVVKHTIYDYADVEQSTHTYGLGEMTIVGTTVTIDLPALAYNQHEFEITVSDARGNVRVAALTYEVDAKTPNAVIAYPTDGTVLDISIDPDYDEDPGESGIQFTMHLDLTKLQTPTGTASTIDILAIPIDALGGVEDTARNRKSWNGFTATLDGADQIFPTVAPLLRLGDGFWRLTVKVTDDHLNVYDTALLPVDQQIDVEVVTDVACSTLHLTANDKVINGTQTVPTWLNSNDGGPTYNLYVETDSPNGTNNACISVNGGADICSNVLDGRADFAFVSLNAGGLENTIELTVNNGATIATDTYYVRADNTDPTLDPVTDVNPEPYVHAGIWEIGYGWNDDIDHDTTTILELDGASARRLIFTIDGIEDIVGYPNHGTVVLTAVDPVDAIGGNTTVNIEKVGADMVAEFDDLTFEDSVVGGQTDIEMLMTITEQPSGNTFTKTIWVHVNLERPEGITPAVTTDPARGEAFVEWSAVIGNNSTYGGAFQDRVYEYQVKYEAYGASCSLDDGESVFDTGVAITPLANFSVADPSLNGDDFVTPKAAGEAQNYLFYMKKRSNVATTITADIHRNGDQYCFAVRASDGIYAQDGTILATNTAPVLSTHVVDKGAVQLTAYELIVASLGSHTMNIKNMGDINKDGETDFAVSDSGQQKAYVFISNVDSETKKVTPPSKVELTKPVDAGTSFGFRLAAADLNGDKHMDVIVSDLGGKNIHIYYGVVDSVDTVRGDMLTFVDNINDIDGIDDFNGDGCDDLAVAQSNYNSNAGRVFVLYGDDKGAAGKTCGGDYTAQTGVSYIGNAVGDRFGYTVRKAGNIKNQNNGGIPLGSFVGGNYNTATNQTKIKAIYGSASPADTTISSYDATLAGLTQLRSGFYGSFNGDAYSDFAVIESGKIKFFFGEDDGSGIDFSTSWVEGTNQITRSGIMDETVGAETGAWGVGSSGATEDFDGDGLADFFVSGVQSQYLYSGLGNFFTKHPSMYLPLPIASGNVQTTILSYGIVLCYRNTDTGNCVIHYY